MSLFDVLIAKSLSGNVISDKQISDAINDYLEENPVASGATPEEAAQIARNKSSIEGLVKDVEAGKAKLSNAVFHAEQDLTDEQKARARENIGAVNSWDELGDKPFSLGDRKVYDLSVDSTDGLESFNIPFTCYGEGYVHTFYKVADITPTPDDIDWEQSVFSEVMVKSGTDCWYVLPAGAPGPFVAYKSTIAMPDYNYGEPFDIPSPGVYTSETTGYLDYIVWTFAEVRTLDERVIPNTIARISDIPKISVTSVNGMTGDVEIDIPEHTWESLPDKPFYGEYKTEEIELYRHSIGGVEIQNDMLIDMTSDSQFGELYDAMVEAEYATLYYTSPMIGGALIKLMPANYPSDMFEDVNSGLMVHTVAVQFERFFHIAGLGNVLEKAIGETAYTLEVTFYKPKQIEEIITLDEKFIPESVARVSALESIKDLVGDTAVSTQISDAIARSQANWEQNDETAVDYIKNKPDENDALTLVAEMGLVTPISNEDGAILVDENNNIIII